MHRKIPMLGSLFNKAAGLHCAILSKKSLWCRCFPMNFEKKLTHIFFEVHISTTASGSALDFFKNGADNYCY